jgi:hypothetical protein
MRSLGMSPTIQELKKYLKDKGKCTPLFTKSMALWEPKLVIVAMKIYRFVMLSQLGPLQESQSIYQYKL